MNQNRSSTGKPIRDADIRRALWSYLLSLHGDDQKTLLVDELGICAGTSRIDIAVINGTIAGYEIKGDRDSLARLPSQQKAYNQVFNQMTIAAAEKHRSELEETIPQWWGICIVTRDSDGIRLANVRQPGTNPKLDKFALVKLLWRAEVVDELQSRGASGKQLRAPRSTLWQILATMLSVQEMVEVIGKRVRARVDWRSGPTPFRCGDLSRSSAKSLHSPANRQWLLSLVSHDHQH